MPMGCLSMPISVLEPLCPGRITPPDSVPVHSAARSVHGGLKPLDVDTVAVHSTFHRFSGRPMARKSSGV